jgi:phytoene dehydrogenase-like protein
MVNRVSRSAESRMSETTTYDAVIVGAGHNGLVCGAYLARAGYRVAMVERRDTVGGACVTDELFPGYRFCTASLVTCLFRQEIVADLDLARHGLEIIPREPSVVALFPDGRSLALGADMAAATAEIGKFSAHDAAVYADYGETMRRLARFAAPYLLGKSRTPLFDDMPALRTALAAADGLPDDDLRRLVTALFGSARSLLDDWFESDELKVTLATDGVVGVDAGPSMPGTAYLMLYHQMGATESARPSWGQVKGGMGGITRALAAACAAHGADIVTGQAVRRIRVGSAGAEAVELDDGRQLRGRVIVSATAPKTTFLDLVDADAVPSGYRHAIGGADFEGVAAKIHLALDRLPQIRGLLGECAEHRGTLQILPSMDHFDAAHAESRLGRPSSEPHVECTIPTVLDPSLAPPGKHVMSMYVQFTPYTLAGTTWEDIKEPFADRVLDYIEPYLPGLTASVLNRKILTPRDLERELALPGGHLYHGAMSARDMFAGRPVAGYADYYTPVPGLYLCGAGTRPGGGVFGMPGKNASDVVRQHLEDDHGRR